ncbi:hypothetical protein CROQUDRAFT_653273 [Cronartium quercuum f. sp. fusiforme G11]|uniref:SUI1 domain-containing protein n=1 Tax=Cronartium quercuum f. sp. fusiforme G11 TaxID=708437 RepID=A0A9P6NSU5_9BASI|nr:hypothetical protein CROQUDRAFT_653273 [Cronartium quercuum f. sp. fusiforme G11]
MFKRPHRTKPGAPISSSARKKIVNEALSAFFRDPLPAHKTLVQQLVPEGLRMARIHTHLDRPLVLYTDVNGEPLWLKLDKGEGILVPSMYTLSKFPSLLPVVCTNQEVLAKLTHGADLMIPGLNISSKEGLRGLAAHALVSISDGAVEEPWAVGYLERSGDELAVSESGKAAITIHTKDDFLWQAGSKCSADKLKLVLPADGPVPQNHEVVKASDDAESLVVKPAIVTPESANIPVPKLSCEEVDKILEAALQRCILAQPPSELPTPASAFYSKNILPLRPHDCPKTVGVKDSSSKTLAKWLKLMQKKGLLVVKEDRKGGELMLYSLNSSHDSLNSSIKYCTMADAEKQEAKQAADDAGALIHGSLASTATSTLTVISELFRASNPAQIQLFQYANLQPHGLHDRQAVRAALNHYIKSQGWAQRTISADALLAQAIGLDGSQRPTTREELLPKLIAALQPWWRLTKGAEVVVEKKGTVPTLTLSLKRAQGARYSTRIAGLELYDINAEGLARQLRNLCAVSTSIHPSLMSPSLQLPKTLLKTATPVEVHCQGDQRKLVRQHLIESVRLPKEAIVDI